MACCLGIIHLSIEICFLELPSMSKLYIYNIGLSAAFHVDCQYGVIRLALLIPFSILVFVCGW